VVQIELIYLFSPNQINPFGNLSLQVGPEHPGPRHVADDGCSDRGGGGRHQQREGGGASSASMVAAPGT